jgi:hypothetical protein
VNNIKMVLGKIAMGGEVLTGLVWLRIEKNGGLL